MEKSLRQKKIAFCITCMNRLSHLQQTLEKNIQDNHLPGKVEFVLLDYNSKDGLDRWIRQNMQSYIDSGILVYYKTPEPAYYLRSHSRNMAFRLADAEILCNLDADNFLGKGFAAFMLQEFSTYNSIFYMNNHSPNDTFGRICVRNKDFISVRGYNEAFKTHGYEDNDFQNRLIQHGLKPMSFHNPEFYRYVLHTDEDRVSDEYIAKNLDTMYISYINPHTSGILLLYKDYTMEQYTITDNSQLNVFSEIPADNDFLPNERNKVMIHEDIVKGTWNKISNKLYIQENDVKYKVLEEFTTIDFRGLTFYKIKDKELRTRLILLLSNATGYNEIHKRKKEKSFVNPEGFGKGTVYKNFDMSKEIILS